MNNYNKAIHLKCITLPVGKKGILNPDEDGYYTMPIGGLNIFNSGGAFYTYHDAKHLFEPSSVLQRKIKKAALFGEWGHPEQQPGETVGNYMNRMSHVNEDKICVHFSEIWLDTEIKKPEVVIMAKLKPFGPYGKYLQESLDNRLIDTMFSIRSFTEDKIINGRRFKKLQEIITFDFVSEPGIYLATKYNSPSLEQYNKMFEINPNKNNTEIRVTEMDLIYAMKLNKQNNIGKENNISNEVFSNLLKAFEQKSYLNW